MLMDGERAVYEVTRFFSFNPPSKRKLTANPSPYIPKDCFSKTERREAGNIFEGKRLFISAKV